MRDLQQLLTDKRRSGLIHAAVPGRRAGLRFVVLIALGLGGGMPLSAAEETASRDPADAASALEETARRPEPQLGPARGRLVLRARGRAGGGEDLGALAVSARVTGPDGEALDASGRGLYAGGRFYADGGFAVEAPCGAVRVEIASGPEYVPVSGAVTVREKEVVEVEAVLGRWFSVRERGWYCGDNHVHAQHDRVASVRTDLAYAALQARANGLDYVTEAGSHAAYDRLEELARPDFLFRVALEMRPGCFVGHFNTPGIRTPLGDDVLSALATRPLPGQQLFDAVHALGGAVIHTHPLTPPHQLHWMGATELLSDAVLGRCADALDVDSPASEALWFAALNLGNRIACSASTDAALGRRDTRSPGERRVYSGSGVLDYAAIVGALRSGRTFATSGGPLFAFLRVEGDEPGGSIRANGDDPLDVEVEIACRNPLRAARAFWRGRTIHSFDCAGRSGRIALTASITPPPARRDGWIVLRAEDDAGNWATTSPVYVTLGGKRREAGRRSAIVIEISNATRFIELRRSFYLHALATVPADERLREVELLQNGLVVRSITSDRGSSLVDRRVPVTELRGEYTRGWIWHPSPDQAYHFQVDWPLATSGWYSVRAWTAAGERLTSDALYFDADHAESHALSAARLRGDDTDLRWLGYGEEMSLERIELPFAGDHWWYPQRSAWRLDARFGAELRRFGSGGAALDGLIREGESERPIRPREWARLFNGADLSGLYTWLRGTKYRDTRGVFSVTGGRLLISGDGLGYIGTSQAYRDYRLVCEFRWGIRNWGARVGKARDSGLFLHAVGPDGNSHDGDGAFRSAIECQIMEGAVGDLILIRGHNADESPVRLALTAPVRDERDGDGWPTWQPGGRAAHLETWGRINWKDKDPSWEDRFGFRGAADVESPAGEWTKLEIEARGDSLRVWTNGVLVNACSRVVPRAGAILLQCEGSEIEFRRLEIGPLRDR